MNVSQFLMNFLSQKKKSLFFSLSRLSSCAAAAVRARCTRLQCADLHSLPPIGSRISCCHFFLWTCIIIAAPLDQTLDNLLGTTISHKLSTTPHSHTLAQRHVEWCNILFISHKKSVCIKLCSLTRHWLEQSFLWWEKSDKDNFFYFIFKKGFFALITFQTASKTFVLLPLSCPDILFSTSCPLGKKKTSKKLWKLMEFAVVRGAPHVTGCPSVRLSGPSAVSLCHCCSLSHTFAHTLHPLSPMTWKPSCDFVQPLFFVLHPCRQLTKDVAVLQLCRAPRAPASPSHNCRHR